MWIRFENDDVEALKSALAYRISEIGKAIDILKDADHPEAAASVATKKLTLENMLSNINKRCEESKLTSPYLTAALENHHEEGRCEFDVDAVVSEGEDPGAYVMGWIWVTDEEAGVQRDDEDKCRTCGEAYADGGDGFDGECPDCADKSDQKINPENYE